MATFATVIIVFLALALFEYLLYRITTYGASVSETMSMDEKLSTINVAKGFHFIAMSKLILAGAAAIVYLIIAVAIS